MAEKAPICKTALYSPSVAPLGLLKSKPDCQLCITCPVIRHLTLLPWVHCLQTIEKTAVIAIGRGSQEQDWHHDVQSSQSWVLVPGDWRHMEALCHLDRSVLSLSSLGFLLHCAMPKLARIFAIILQQTMAILMFPWNMRRSRLITVFTSHLRNTGRVLVVLASLGYTASNRQSPKPHRHSA